MQPAAPAGVTRHISGFRASTSIMLAFCLGLACCCMFGCAGYRLGARTLYNPNIRTVYVPIIRNDTLRYTLGVQLTEAVVRAVELDTPYKVVASPSADSTLNCRITTQAKRTIAEAPTDEQRAIEALVSIELSWVDRQGNLLMENRFVPDGEISYFFLQGSDFAPEGGQSMGTTQQRIIELLADKIVQQMESRW